MPPKTLPLWVLICSLMGYAGTQAATLSTAPPSPESENRAANNTPTARITNGTLTTEYPAVGYLSAKENKDGYCSATLIGPRTVLTAAHCVHGEKSGWFANDFIGESWSEVRSHPNYDKNSDYDIALVILDSSVDNVTPARLGKASVSAGDPLTLIGYGYSNNDTSTWRPNEKYVGENTVSSVDPLWFAYKGHSNNCSGDSGGPAFTGDALVGVHAWGDGNKACSATTGWDVRVDIYIDWLIDNAADSLSFADGSQSNTPDSPISTPPVPTQPDTPTTASISMTKSDFQIGESIRVAFTNLPENKRDWIGLYEHGTSEFEILDWQYTDGARSGNLTFDTALNAGSYEARLFFDDSYNRESTVTFSISTNSTDTPVPSDPASPTPIDPEQPTLASGVSIKKAEFKAKKSELKIELISTLSPDLSFEILGHGPMSQKQKNGSTIYKYKKKGASNPGSTVTAQASNGQEITINLNLK